MNEESKPRHGAAFATSRADRDRTLMAIHGLEGAAAQAAPSDGWLVGVERYLAVLEDALAEEDARSLRPDSLLSLIAAEDPRRFGGRIRRLRDQRSDIIRQVEALLGQLDHNDGHDAAELRHRMAWLVRAVHHYRAMETDLVYEALARDLTSP